MLMQPSAAVNIDYLVRRFGASSDFTVKPLKLPWLKGENMLTLCYLDTLVDQDKLDRMMDSVMAVGHIADDGVRRKLSSSDELLTYMRDTLLSAVEAELTGDMLQIEKSLLIGRSVMIAGGQALIMLHTIGSDHRGVEEPSTQTVIRGPRDGFTETLRTNISLVRKRIRHPDLRVEIVQMGNKTNTYVAFMYMNNVVEAAALEQLRKRLAAVHTESVLESGYIEEWIKEPNFTPFPTVFNTERPDVTASGLLEGRIAVLVDGTPFVLLTPALFVQFFQAAEDYYHPALFSILRLLRFLAALGALLAPAVYVAVTTYHPDMIPTTLLISLMAQREGIPFPAFVEAMIMEVTFEVLREAGVRMPKMIGQAISIVGALVLGEAAVQAGLISAAVVIVVAFTAITNLMIPAISMGNTVRLLRFLFMIAGAMFGLYGIFIGMTIMLIHLSRQQSFGIPYLFPVAPFSSAAMRDTFFRMPRKNNLQPGKLFNKFRSGNE